MLEDDMRNAPSAKVPCNLVDHYDLQVGYAILLADPAIASPLSATAFAALFCRLYRRQPPQPSESQTLECGSWTHVVVGTPDDVWCHHVSLLGVLCKWKTVLKIIININNYNITARRCVLPGRFKWRLNMLSATLTFAQTHHCDMCWFG